MALLEKFRSHITNVGRSDHRAYFSLIRENADTPDALNRLAMLALKLGKTSDQIETDRKAILTLPAIRAKISAARDVTSDVENAQAAVREHQKQTEQIAAQRKNEEQSLRGELGRLLGIKNAGEDAIGELAKLKATHPELLADEAAVGASDLK